MLIIRLTESELHNMLATATKRLINESQESKSISQAKRLLMQRLGYDEQQADEFIRIKLRNDLPVLRTPEGGKFILGVTRMFIDRQINSANDISSLNSTLKLVASNAHINEYDRNLNGLSCRDLIQRFSTVMNDNIEAERSDINQMAFDTPSDYEIVRIDSFEQASEYGDYTTWCVTHDEDMFDSYTSDGINQFYFCLKHGFEGIKPKVGENAPLDEYGLSMIAVNVDYNGALNTCTCRWNHDNGGDDSIMNAKQISQVVGVNFYNVFKPNTVFKDMVESAIQTLRNGANVKDVFDWCSILYDGFATVRLNGKYNFLSTNTEFLSDVWFDWGGTFFDGVAVVELRNKCNYINKNGKMISDAWFDECGCFHDGFGVVALNNKWNYISANGELLSDVWFDDCNEFNDGFGRVKLNNKWNFITTNGGLLSDVLFDKCYTFDDGFAVVKLNYKYNYINTNGKIISDVWFDGCYDFIEGFGAVKLNNKWNFITTNGGLLSDVWFDECYGFNDGFGHAVLRGKDYRISTTGEISPL